MLTLIDLNNPKQKMERKDFLRLGMSSLGLMTINPLINACKSSVETTTQITGTTSSTGSTNGSSANDCTVNPTETEGPYPTHSPTSYVIQDIKAGKSGVNMTASITIKNKNNGCGALQGAIVDIWHCDADGNYSEYGSLTNSHFLRGRQTTDANGLVNFETIFPGWYSGRAVHIHVHVYNASGKSLLVTQIAFPANVCDTVFTTATTVYKKGKADTTNEKDGIFSDGYTNQLAGITGDIIKGMVMTHNIVVSA
jgi:protocatechuate 3,4-dioxygenase beta subunit